MVEFTVKCSVIVCTRTAHGNMSRGKKCIKTNGYKLVLPSGGPSGKYTKY